MLQSQIDQVMEIINGLDRHGRLNPSDVDLVSSLLKSQVVIAKSKINPLVSNYKDSINISSMEINEKDRIREALRNIKPTGNEGGRA